VKPSVRTAFVAFSEPLEGSLPYLYTDILGLVTTGIGNLVDPVSLAVSLPWVRPDGTPASQAEIVADWQRVKAQNCGRYRSPEGCAWKGTSGVCLAHQGHRAARSVTTIRLTPEGVQEVVGRKLEQNDLLLLRRFPDWESWPADAQLATHSMAWACGPSFVFPQLAAALRAQDFRLACTHCTISEAGNPGIVPRNVLNRRLYLNAARVVEWKLDPEELHWPTDLEDMAPTEPELPAAPESGVQEPDGGESRWRATSEAVVEAVRGLVTRRSAEGLEE
jgi:GH24 family phage-related lysozyme (muramidase)